MKFLLMNDELQFTEIVLTDSEPNPKLILTCYFKSKSFNVDFSSFYNLPDGVTVWTEPISKEDAKRFNLKPYMFYQSIGYHHSALYGMYGNVIFTGGDYKTIYGLRDEQIKEIKKSVSNMKRTNVYWNGEQKPILLSCSCGNDVFESSYREGD